MKSDFTEDAFDKAGAFFFITGKNPLRGKRNQFWRTRKLPETRQVTPPAPPPNLPKMAPAQVNNRAAEIAEFRAKQKALKAEQRAVARGNLESGVQPQSAGWSTAR